MIKIKTLLSLAVGLATLTACVEPTTTAAPSSATFTGPGSDQVSMTEALAIYDTVCIKNAPGFAGSKTPLGAMPFQQNPATGTYFHKTLDLSVKLEGNACSMVFASPEPAGMLGIAFATQVGAGSGNTNLDIGMDPTSGMTMTQGPSGTSFSFRPAIQNAGRSYYQALLQ